MILFEYDRNPLCCSLWLVLGLEQATFVVLSTLCGRVQGTISKIVIIEHNTKNDSTGYVLLITAMADQEHWKSASESSKVLSLTKNKINLGSFEDHLFQLSIKFNAEGTVATPDPMDISVFDIFGFPCVPLTGNNCKL
jgi:hypothetical protein